MTTAKMKFLLGYNMNIFILCEGGNDPLVRGNKNLVEESTGGGGLFLVEGGMIIFLASGGGTPTISAVEKTLFSSKIMKKFKSPIWIKPPFRM